MILGEEEKEIVSALATELGAVRNRLSCSI